MLQPFNGLLVPGVLGPQRLQPGADLILAPAQLRTPLASHLELADGLGSRGQPLLDIA